MTAPIIIEPYDPQWPEHFAILRSKISTALGTLAEAIDHVGSTAVPGLAAKPIIDVDALLQSASDLPIAIRRLATSGYHHQGDLGVHGREAFRAPASDFPHHLYVCSPECLEYRRHIAFRNHLRSCPEDASAYANLKRTIADRFHTDREAYTQAKTEFVQSILRHAQLEIAEHSCRAGRIIL